MDPMFDPPTPVSEKTPLLGDIGRQKSQCEYEATTMPALDEEQEEDGFYDHASGNDLEYSAEGLKRHQTTSFSSSKERSINLVIEKEKTCWQKFHDAVTMEPVMFMYYFVNSALITTVTQYVYARFADDYVPNLNVSESFTNLTESCGYSGDEDDSEAQSSAATFLIVFNFILAGPGIVLSLFLGSYSDHHGRKLNLILAFLGVFLRAAMCTVTAVFNLNVMFLFLAAGLEGLLGGQCSIKSSVYAYIADISQKNDRNTRMFVVQMMSTFGNAIAQISIGYLISYTGFVYPFLMETLIAFVILPFMIFYIRESVDVSKQSGKTYSIIDDIKETLNLLLKDDGTERLWILRGLTVVIAIMYFTVDASMDMTSLYAMGYPVCFDSIMLGYLNAFYYIGSCFVPLGLLTLLRLKFSDFVFAVLAIAFASISKFWYNILLDPIPLMFIAAAFNFLATMCSPLIRSSMSKNVDPHEQGALSSCITMVTTSAFLLGCLVNNGIYSATYAIYREIAFNIDGVLLVFALVIAIGLRIAVDRVYREQQSLPPEEVARQGRFSRQVSYVAERRYSADIAMLSPHT